MIGLGLCPFARRVFDAGRIRYAISYSRDKNTLSNDLASELHLLLASPSTQIETTLLIHPHVLGNFLDYNDYLGVVDQLLEELRLRAVEALGKIGTPPALAALRGLLKDEKKSVSRDAARVLTTIHDADSSRMVRCAAEPAAKVRGSKLHRRAGSQANRHTNSGSVSCPALTRASIAGTARARKISVTTILLWVAFTARLNTAMLLK